MAWVQMPLTRMSTFVGVLKINNAPLLAAVLDFGGVVLPPQSTVASH